METTSRGYPAAYAAVYRSNVYFTVIREALHGAHPSALCHPPTRREWWEVLRGDQALSRDIDTVSLGTRPL